MLSTISRKQLSRFTSSIIPTTLNTTAYKTRVRVMSTVVTDPLKHALSAEKPIHNWTKEEITKIYNTPLMELLFQAQVQHRKYNDPSEIQLCTLLSIKTGGCTEDCKYCAQSSRNETGVKAEKMIKFDAVIEKAKQAKANGSTRFCMGAAWRDMNGRKSGLKRIGEMVKYINDELKMETCVTLD
ncbi:unnamed protein product [Ambrosiozyma monospora]|uniref:Unnamed protein product n=1 Tax=Ambrosiozyma monospora TaxID=43982 RepID=A0ACB5TWW2_AMBMO|nr:unnamed protein product [Ambrosiozyma monospora]